MHQIGQNPPPSPPYTHQSSATRHRPSDVTCFPCLYSVICGNLVNLSLGNPLPNISMRTVVCVQIIASSPALGVRNILKLVRGYRLVDSECNKQGCLARHQRCHALLFSPSPPHCRVLLSTACCHVPALTPPESLCAPLGMLCTSLPKNTPSLALDLLCPSHRICVSKSRQNESPIQWRLPK